MDTNITRYTLDVVVDTAEHYAIVDVVMDTLDRVVRGTPGSFVTMRDDTGEHGYEYEIDMPFGADGAPDDRRVVVRNTDDPDHIVRYVVTMEHTDEREDWHRVVRRINEA